MDTNHTRYYEVYDEVTFRRDDGFKKVRQSEVEPEAEMEKA